MVWEGDRAQSRSLYLIRGAYSEAVTDPAIGGVTNYLLAGGTTLFMRA